MYLRILHVLILVNNIFCKNGAKFEIDKISPENLKMLKEHTMVTSNDVFPYMCAILRKSTYISAGALIHESWVLTGGDALFLVRESARELRVRLGSINYRKGGVLTPIKLFEIHPYFSDTKPDFDIALIKLPKPVRLSLSLNPIRVQRRMRDITATHFIVTSWPNNFKEKSSDELQKLTSMEMIKRRRILTVSHLHPSDPEKCLEELEGLDVNVTSSLMCLDPSPDNDPCSREVGAPVVLNGILWGIISSWKPEECELESGLSFASLVSHPDISSWIHVITRDQKWTEEQFRVTVDEQFDDDYIDTSEDEDYKAKSTENEVIV